MKPTQARRQDWRMYYNATVMRHAELGIVHVKVEDNAKFYVSQVKLHRVDPDIGIVKHADWELAKPADLDIWFPRAGAYNIEGEAMYISRKAERSMKKSATANNHYRITYGPRRNDLMFVALARGYNHLSWPVAQEVMEKDMARAVAVTRDIILEKDEDKYNIIFRGQEVGKLVEGEFLPTHEYAPATKLTFNKLYKEGILL